MSIMDRISHAWDVFRDRPRESMNAQMYMSSSPSYMSFNNRYKDSSIADTIYNRIAVDVSAMEFEHVKITEGDPEQGIKEDTIPQDSLLNNCLSIEANLDQNARQFIHDIVITMCEEGVAAVVPVKTTASPVNSNAYDIKEMRVGTITQWYPKSIMVNLYNDEKGKRQSIVVPKNMVAIIENPFRATMAKNNATLRRLIRALSLSDYLDKQITNNQLNLILQVPYATKNEILREQANQRVKDIQEQLSEGTHGIAYADGVEKITQLNRPISNNIDERIKALEERFYNQLGLNEEMLKGKFKPEQYLNYHNQTLEPFAEAISLELKRKFLSKTARTQGQTIKYYNDVFKYIPVDKVAQMGDSLKRNAILTANEIRGIIGYRPIQDPMADLLMNPNIADVNQIQNEFNNPGMVPEYEEGEDVYE